MRMFIVLVVAILLDRYGIDIPKGMIVWAIASIVMCGAQDANSYLRKDN